jgi:hypothetical protein
VLDTNQLNIVEENMKKHLFFPIVLCMIAHAIIIAPVEGSMVRRAIINNGTCAPAITISVTPTESISTYALIETLPFGLSPLYINENGQWHPEKQHIRWGNFRDHTARSFTYDLTGMNGDYQIMDCIFSADGIYQEITITSSVSLNCTQTHYQNYNPPIPEEPTLDPVSPPLFISDNQIVPAYLDITCTTQDSTIFFTTDGSRPTTESQQYTGTIYISRPAIIRAIAIKSGMKQSTTSEMRFHTPVVNAIHIHRSLFNNESCAPAITIHVTPNENVQTYAIMEQLPFGATPYDINENGQWDMDSQTIRWGNYRDNAIRSLSYSLTAVNGSYSIHQMIYSADGLAYDITKNTTVTLDCPLPEDYTSDHPDPEPEPEIISTPVFHTSSDSETLQFSITCDTSDTIIYYTTDGSRPTQDDFIYSNPIALTNSKKIRAIAIKEGRVSSETALFDYAITPTTPQFGEISVQVENNQSCYPKVVFTVIPESDIQTYAVEIFIPNGLNLFSISDGGILNDTQNSIRWGNFRDHQGRELSFRMDGDNQQATINGIVGFDGHSQEILDIAVEIACDSPALIISADEESLTLKEPVHTMLNVSNSEGGYVTIIVSSSDQMLISDEFIQLGDSLGNPYVTHLEAGVSEPVSITMFRADSHYGEATIVISAYDSNGLSASCEILVNVLPETPQVSWIVSSSLMIFDDYVYQASSTLVESSCVVQITATLSNVSNLPVTVSYIVESTATNGVDYILENGTHTMPAFTQFLHLTMTILDDVNDEYNETIKVIMTDITNALAGQETVYTLVIRDDDNPPCFKFCENSYSASESLEQIKLSVCLDDFSEKPISIEYDLILETAIQGEDFTFVNDTLFFEPGTKALNFSIPLIDDNIHEPTETLSIKLLNGTNAVPFWITSTQLIIYDDETALTLSVMPSNYTISAESIVLPITMSNITANETNINWDVIPQTDWITVETNPNGFNNGVSMIQCSMNPKNTWRNGVVLIQSNDTINQKQYVQISQGPNHLPEISPIPDQTTTESKPFLEIHFTVSDIETNPCDLNFHVTSSAIHIIDEFMISETCERRSLQMTPHANVTGNTTIAIIVSDAQGLTASTSFTASVVANMPPVAVGETLMLDEDKFLYILLKATDTEDDPLSYTWVQPPAHGQLTIENDIAIYTPHPNYNKMDRFSFKANDGFSDSNTADIVLTIYPIDDPPVAIDLRFQTTENKSLSFSFPLTDVDGEILTHTIVDPPKHGSLSETSQSLTYQPETWFWGTDTMVYTLTDGHTVSSTATVTITINQADEYTLSLDYSNEIGEIEINGTTVLLPWQGSFAADSKVTLKAITTSDDIFEFWQGDVEHPTENPLIVTMSRGKSISVRFMPPKKMVKLLGYQSINIHGETFSLPLEKVFYRGDQISLKALPLNIFKGWSGDITGTQNPIDIEIQNHMTVGVLFSDSREWAATITAEAIELSPVHTDEITIGVSLLPQKIPDELPNEYGCSLLIYSPDWDKNSKDIREFNTTEYSWMIAVNPHGNIGSPESRTTFIRWNPQHFSDKGFFRMYRGYDQTGECVVEDMRTLAEFAVTGIESVQIFNIVWSMKEPTTAHINTQAGWNLISLPVIPQDSHISVLFPDATIAYEYKDGAYINVDQLVPGKGYWLKTPSSTGYDVIGEPFQSYTNTYNPGWHLIGALFDAVDNPYSEDCVEVIFGYQNGAYAHVTELVTGRGYWIKVKRECVLEVGN